ncbi:MAG: copper chaperone [Proteobacteria bacterium]|nr:copper chaperone [Pseudomonadota bacterium]NDF00163.1 copper chaperone [Verrucomicrobiota bacterium]
MKNLLLTALFATLALNASAADSPKAGKVTATFYINEVKCSTCANALDESLRKLPSVSKVDNLSESTGLANVTFDPKAVSYHQVAQAIFATEPVHSNPYIATLKFSIDGYAKGDNAAKVDAILAKHKSEVRPELKNKANGEFVLFFEPLKVSAAKKGPQGWSYDEFAAEVQAAGMKVTLAAE